MAATTPLMSQRFIVIPFRKGARNRLTMGEMRQASSAASAERVATNMSDRFAGVLAYEVTVEHESGDLSDPRLLFKKGETFDIMGDR